ncbi:hypothetical protein AGRA3207_001500 [Actinomadura graeca]|uniref:Uncharacterized protein n=1 Tax=Actinomadura graeca TaxID=2750812 RepID=A0ABX8QPL7_9ACTN|nr:hypothetical protein [Actinomadura graeca]QXJ20735.1 hypothetical protein AGRA3207_001500 [Actinomadura graeca]
MFVAIMGYLQWRGGERRRVQSEVARQELEQAELRRTASGAYNQQRLEVLRELLDKLHDLEIQSRLDAKERDLRAELPRINTFLIKHGTTLTEEEHQLTRQFLEALTWIDHVKTQERARWEEERARRLAEEGVDIGSYEDSWALTGPIAPLDGAAWALQQWASARDALEDRLRDALRGM